MGWLPLNVTKLTQAEVKQAELNIKQNKGDMGKKNHCVLRLPQEAQNLGNAIPMPRGDESNGGSYFFGSRACKPPC